MSAETTQQLWTLPLREAAAQRWSEGRAKFGAEWIGAHPLRELLAELADGLNYAREAERLGWPLDMERIEFDLEHTYEMIREAINGAALDCVDVTHDARARARGR